jgi:hypothetical protein
MCMMADETRKQIEVEQEKFRVVNPAILLTYHELLVRTNRTASEILDRVLEMTWRFK